MCIIKRIEERGLGRSITSCHINRPIALHDGKDDYKEMFDNEKSLLEKTRVWAPFEAFTRVGLWAYISDFI